MVNVQEEVIMLAIVQQTDTEQSVFVEVEGLYQFFLHSLDVIDFFDGECKGLAVVDGL